LLWPLNLFGLTNFGEKNQTKLHYFCSLFSFVHPIN